MEKNRIKQPDCVGLTDEMIRSATQALTNALYEEGIKCKRKVVACIVVVALSILLIGFLIYTKIY